MPLFRLLRVLLSSLFLHYNDSRYCRCIILFSSKIHFPTVCSNDSIFINYRIPDVTFLTILFKPNQVVFNNVDKTNMLMNTKYEQRTIPPSYNTMNDCAMPCITRMRSIITVRQTWSLSLFFSRPEWSNLQYNNLKQETFLTPPAITSEPFEDVDIFETNENGHAISHFNSEIH